MPIKIRLAARSDDSCAPLFLEELAVASRVAFPFETITYERCDPERPRELKTQLRVVAERARASLANAKPATCLYVFPAGFTPVRKQADELVQTLLIAVADRKRVLDVYAPTIRNIRTTPSPDYSTEADVAAVRDALVPELSHGERIYAAQLVGVALAGYVLFCRRVAQQRLDARQPAPPGAPLN